MVALGYAIALTGSIATGKSTVCNLLKLYGFRVIDADEIAHKVLDEEAAQIASLFGKEYVVEGKVDRKRLGKLVFSSKEQRLRLERLLHPKIKVKILQEAKKEERFKVPYIVDIPLFFETRNYPEITKVAVVYAPKELQLLRLTKRDRLSQEEAKKRIALQIDIEQKRAWADYVIDNSKDLKYLQNEVEKFVERLKDEYALG